MKRVKVYKRHLWNLYVFPLVLFTTVSCYPTGKSADVEVPQDIRDEKRFPNGTVIGKYMYTDNEGNPIQVKYYADDASYGVELKSIKVVETTGEPLSSETTSSGPDSAPSKLEYNFMKSRDNEVLKLPSELLGSSNNNNFGSSLSFKYNKNNYPFDFLNKEINKANRYKIEKSNTPDYEIFYQNDLKGPKKCGKEKLRVYFDKNNRKIRSAVNDVDKFCEQF